MIEFPRTIDIYTRTTSDAGNLMIAESAGCLPFEPKRLFWIAYVPSGVTRGKHAHKCMKEVAVCLKGSVSVHLVVPGWYDENYVLDNPSKGLYIPPCAWREILFGEEALLLAMVSTEYDESDYFRDWEQYIVYIKDDGSK